VIAHIPQPSPLLDPDSRQVGTAADVRHEHELSHAHPPSIARRIREVRSLTQKEVEMRTRGAAFLLAAAAAAALTAACGGNGYGGGATTTGAPATTAAAGGGDARASGNGGIDVTAADFSFSPATIEASAGAPITITLKNQGAATHTLTVYADENFTRKVAGADSGRVPGGGSASFTTTFASAGDLYFRCELHPSQMQGEITVK